MKIKDATEAKGLRASERKARLSAMVERGEITPEQAALIDFREPPDYVREHGRKLASNVIS